MHRSMFGKPRRALAAACRTLVVMVTLLSLVGPSVTWAGTPYSVRWLDIQDATSCLRPALEREGDAIFSVNQMPLPTYEVAGALSEHAGGSRSNTMEAEFDSVLLRMGRSIGWPRGWRRGGRDLRRAGRSRDARRVVTKQSYAPCRPERTALHLVVRAPR
jgi:hypothetical protein